MAKIGKSRLEALYLLVFVGFWGLLVKMPGLDGYWLLAFLEAFACNVWHFYIGENIRVSDKKIDEFSAFGIGLMIQKNNFKKFEWGVNSEGTSMAFAIDQKIEGELEWYINFKGTSIG